MNSYLNFIRLQWPLLSFGFLTVFIGNVGQSFFLSWFGADIQKDLVLSATDYGMIYALATLCSSMTIMFVGGLVDKWDIRSFVTVVAILLVVACVVMSYVVSPLMLFFAFFMLRLAGQGLLPHTAQTTMIRSYSHQRGKAISLASSGVAFGEVILPIIVVLLISWIGWRSSWLVFASVVAFVYLPLAYILLAKSTRFKGNTKKTNTQGNVVSNKGRRHVLSDWRFWAILPAVLAAPFVVTGVFIQQHFLLTQKEWLPSLLANSFIAYGIMHWLSSMVAGSLVDKYSARHLLPFMIIPLFLGLCVLSLFNQSWSAVAFMTLFGVGIGVSSPVINALWAEVYGTEHIGSIRSMMTSLMIFSTAASPWVLGLFIELGWNERTLFGMLSVIIFMVGLMVLPAYKAYLKR